MGCAHSRSEDLTMPERVLQSVESSDGYFRQTLQTPMDYIIKSEVAEKQNEMSYHGPPSHLQNSVDVHPFWHFYGRDYIPKERYVDKSHEKPLSLMPTAESAHQLRTIELQETMHSLRKQVVGVISKKTNERKAAAKVADKSDQSYHLTKEEQSTLDFLEAALDDFDDAYSQSSYSSLDTNMNVRKNPLVVDDDIIVDPNSRIGTRVHHSAMYLPSVSTTTRHHLQERIHLQNDNIDTSVKVCEKNVGITDTRNVNDISIKNVTDNVIRRQDSQNAKNQSIVNVKPLSKSYIEEKPEKDKLQRRTSSVRDLVRHFSLKTDKEKIDNDFINEQDELHICGEYKESNIRDDNDNVNKEMRTPGRSRRKSIDDMSDDSAIVTEAQDLVDENFSTTQAAVKGHRKLTVSDSTLTQKSVDSGIS